VRAAVLGHPVAHSLSPRLHRAAYAALGLDWTYDAVDVTADGLRGFLDGLGPEWAGLSLTMPLKQTVLPLLDEVSELASATGAANTVVLRDGRRSGDNTDVGGIVEALREAGVGAVARSVVVGAGATAASALAALARLGDRAPRVLARNPDRAGPLLAAAERLGVRPVVVPLSAGPLDERDVDVVVSTVPAGALDALCAGLVPGAGALLDVVYAPWPTALAAAYARAGAVVVPGTAMLLHQAVAQVELMTGRRPPVDALRAALVEGQAHRET
jgi:shikimate dehydrogenase